MLELEVTRTLRRAQDTTTDVREKTSVSSESFQLFPKRLNFDNCSQKSGAIPASPAQRLFLDVT